MSFVGDEAKITSEHSTTEPGATGLGAGRSIRKISAQPDVIRVNPKLRLAPATRSLTLPVLYRVGHVTSRPPRSYLVILVFRTGGLRV
jgi:hypothetical protein